MKHRTKVRLFWIVLGLVAVCSPIAIQKFMTGAFNSVQGGSDDGWLGFWGGYLGAIISIAGVYRSIKAQHEDNWDNRILGDRPVLRSTPQRGIHINDWVYHSTTSINFKRFSGFFFRVENVGTRPALDIIVAVYGVASGQPLDIISIPSLVNKAVLVSYRNPKGENGEEFQKDRIEIAYKTIDGEVGCFVEKFTNDESLNFPYTIWGESAKTKYQLMQQQFNQHNQNNSEKPLVAWHQNMSIFSEQDVKYYEKVREAMFRQEYPDLAKEMDKTYTNNGDSTTNK